MGNKLLLLLIPLVVHGWKWEPNHNNRCTGVLRKKRTVDPNTKNSSKAGVNNPYVSIGDGTGSGSAYGGNYKNYETVDWANGHAGDTVQRAQEACQAIPNCFGIYRYVLTTKSCDSRRSDGKDGSMWLMCGDPTIHDWIPAAVRDTAWTDPTRACMFKLTQRDGPTQYGQPVPAPVAPAPAPAPPTGCAQYDGDKKGCKGQKGKCVYTGRKSATCRDITCGDYTDDGDKCPKKAKKKSKLTCYFADGACTDREPPPKKCTDITDKKECAKGTHGKCVYNKGAKKCHGKDDPVPGPDCKKLKKKGCKAAIKAGTCQASATKNKCENVTAPAPAPVAPAPPPAGPPKEVIVWGGRLNHIRCRGITKKPGPFDAVTNPYKPQYTVGAGSGSGYGGLDRGPIREKYLAGGSRITQAIAQKRCEDIPTCYAILRYARMSHNGCDDPVNGQPWALCAGPDLNLDWPRAQNEGTQQMCYFPIKSRMDRDYPGVPMNPGQG